MDIERFKEWMGFSKFILGTVLLSLVATGINYHFQKKEIEIKEMEQLGNYVEQAIDENLAVQQRFAEYFATMTTSKELKSRWTEYKDVIDSKIAQEEAKRVEKKEEAEKKQIADQVIALLEQRFSGLADQVEMRDVATPMTWERYTGNWQASHEGWLMTTKNLNMRLSKTLPGLKNFYMAGQWVEPGGSLPYVAVSGRNVIQIICKKDKKSFCTTSP